MLAAWESFEQHVDQVKGLSRGRLRVAAVSTAKYFIPRLVGSFCRLHPQIDVSLAVLNRDGVVDRLRDNRDDIYIMSMPPDLDLEDAVFMENPLVLIAARGARLGTRLTLAQVKEQRFILREPGSGTRMATDRHFARHRFKPDVRLELGSNEAIKEAVAGGLGIGVISRHALQGGRGVRELPVEGFPISSRWHVVHPRAKRLSPIAAAFRAHLLAHGRPA
jgi:DNA-binding transcriptional LysR family regulator